MGTYSACGIFRRILCFYRLFHFTQVTMTHGLYKKSPRASFPRLAGGSFAVIDFAERDRVVRRVFESKRCM